MNIVVCIYNALIAGISGYSLHDLGFAEGTYYLPYHHSHQPPKMKQNQDVMNLGSRCHLPLGTAPLSDLRLF
jgi:hypothetical protein